MKKTLAEAAAFFLLSSVLCASPRSLDEYTSFFTRMSVDGKVESNKIACTKSWGLWGRTDKKLNGKIDSQQNYSFTYKAEDDFAIMPCDEITVKDKNKKIDGPTAYIFYAELFVDEGTVGPCFILRNQNDEVINWEGGYQEIHAKNEWQSCAATVIVCNGEQPSLIPSWMSGVTNSDVNKIQPRFIGDGIAKGKSRNVQLLKVRLQAPVQKTVVVQNSTLSLSLNSAEQTFAVTDKRTGRTYTQRPGDLHGAITVSCDKKNDSVAFTAIDCIDIRMLTFTATLDDDTIRCELSDEYTSSRNANSKAPDALSLRSIDSMSGTYAFPGAINVPANEYFVLPINEGISFYGNDPDMLTGDWYANYGHGMSMPFFGATDGKAGWMVVLDSSDDAGMRLSQFAGMNYACPVWDSECGSLGYTRKWRYIFVSDGGYVAIAKKYRAIAKQNGTLVTFTQKKAQRGQEGARRIETLRGTVNFWTWTDGTAEFCKQVYDSGINHILWSCKGSPRDVETMNKMDGVLTGRYDIYQDVMNPKNFNKIWYVSEDWVTEAFPKEIAVREDGGMVEAWPVEEKDDPKKEINCVSLCDMTAPSYARKRIGEELKTHAFGARFLDTTTASSLRECYSPDHPMTHAQSKAARVELLGVVSKENHLVCGSETGADYAVPVCDYFEGMLSLGPYRIDDAGRFCDQIVTSYPERVTKFMLGEKYRLPLWELVYHDCTVSMWYWGDFNNKMPDLWDKRDLFNALYACPPMFFTNKKDFSQQQERFVKSYKASAAITYATFDTEMIDHQFLTDDRTVQQTTFANGISVIVNFGDKEFVKNQMRVAPKSIYTIGIQQ